MKVRLHMLVFAALATAALAFSQPITVDGPYQVRYASNLINGGDAVVNITNTGASADSLVSNVITPQNNINGSICVNIYAYAADEQEVSCCSCLVTPNALWSASVKNSLLNLTLTPSFPNEVVIKLISTVPNGDQALGTESCNPATINSTTAVSGNTNGTGPGTLAKGLLAWGTSVHASPCLTATDCNTVTETPFLPATLTRAELQRDVVECQFIQILGSGQFGICKGCQNVGLGANAQ